MITIRLSGGLGNQMFQYAAARCLALRRHTDFSIDTAYYDSSASRRAALGQFRCPQATAPALRSWLARRQRRAGLAWLAALPSVPRWYREASFRFDPRVLDLPSHTYLQGYFQSPHYFVDCARQIRADFTFPQFTDAANSSIAAHIANSCAVAVHMRLGDYAGSRRARARHGVLGADYYERAFKTLRARVAAPHFFVFTDDAPAAAKTLHAADTTIIDPHRSSSADSASADNALRDMQLMSLCRHQIIANSSFSWWGAWLNENPKKIVIAPQHWFQPDVDASTDDLLPTQWLRL